VTIVAKFCGAAGTVTGSATLVTHPRGRVLIDCGLFQGPKTLRELNYGPLPFDAAAVDAVLLTHAHIDHSGLLPKLVAAGYKGKILATEGTVDLLTWLLPDSGAIQEAEVERLNRRNQRRGRPTVQPIYTRADAEATLKRLEWVDFERWIEVSPGARARFWNAGHILGAASIELEIATGAPKQRLIDVLFSGDLGPGNKSFHPAPKAPENHDYIVMETTYGDRDRVGYTEAQRRELLRTEVAAAVAAGGNLLIPAFAVERTQELLNDLVCLMASGAMARLQVFLDSPLAVRATEVFEKHLGAVGASPFRADNIRFVTEVGDSAALARITRGAVIIAGSGMCDAGRIRFHLRNNLWRPEATVLLVGYQAPGTLGNLLAQGQNSVSIQGEEIAVRARIRSIDAYSGHADRSELVAWLKDRLPVRRGLILSHGETGALTAMKEAAVGLGLEAQRVVIPRMDQSVVLYPADRPRLQRPAEAPRLPTEALAVLEAGRDWHNAYAQFLLDLRHRLHMAADDRTREAIMRRARRAFDETPR
jgi:metallo-beta-lactamase family protein